jgi:hypothetical protein
MTLSCYYNPFIYTVFGGAVTLITGLKPAYSYFWYLGHMAKIFHCFFYKQNLFTTL